MVEIVKRDGRREQYDSSKLARSLARAGVSPQMAAGILANVAAGPDMDTGSLRKLVESVLALRQPSAARRYCCTRSLAALESEQAGYGWACVNPETATRLSLRPGDTAWLGYDGTAAPFSIESLEEVQRGHAWLNRREMAAMGVSAGTRLAASSVYQTASPSLEEVLDYGRAHATSPGAGRNGGW